jgi:hypothetical protein
MRHPKTSLSVAVGICALTISTAHSVDLCKASTSGNKCLVVVSNANTTQLEPGQPIPTGSSMLLNPQYYGLPPVRGYWRYYHIGDQVYRVTPDTLKVIEIVHEGNALVH